MARRPEQIRDHDDMLIRALRRLTVESDRFVEELGQAYGLHRTDLSALALVIDAGRSLSPGELAEQLHLSASATTALLDRLEAAGHIRRARSTTDRRRVELRPGPEVPEFGRRVFAPLRGELAEAWAGFTAEQREVIERFLTASIEATVRAKSGLTPRPR